MSLEDIANSIVGLIFIVLFSAIVICLLLCVYFYFTETPVPPSAEEIKQRDEKYQKERANKAVWLCFSALGAFILGGISGKAKFHTIGLCLIVGALFWDYKTVAAALFMWYFVVPVLILGGIIALIKGVFR